MALQEAREEVERSPAFAGLIIRGMERAIITKTEMMADKKFIEQYYIPTIISRIQSTALFAFQAEDPRGRTADTGVEEVEFDHRIPPEVLVTASLPTPHERQKGMVVKRVRINERERIICFIGRVRKNVLVPCIVRGAGPAHDGPTHYTVSTSVPNYNDELYRLAVVDPL